MSSIWRCASYSIACSRKRKELSSGAVQINTAHAVQCFVKRLAGVLFKVRAGEPDRLFAVRHVDPDLAALHDGDLVLADLVALRKVGVKIVLAREDRAAVDRAAHRGAEADCVLYGGAVEHRKHAPKR